MNASFEVLAEINIPKYIPSSTSVDSRISATWRPDGSLCAVSSIDVEDSMRNVRIYKRETLEPHAIGRSEDASGALVKNLQNANIAWAGTGCSQLLASVQRKGKKTHQVVFFEPNGLRHREFLLREAPSTVVSSLHWNATSDVLAVVLREEDGTDKIQLWHRCNYHWYLKRELRYHDRRVQLVKFSKDNPHELIVLLDCFEWREYEVRWDPSTTLSFQDSSLAFVVDGSSLNLTAFNKAVIPPPMFANTYKMDFPISGITFCKATQYLGSSLILMSNGDLVFLHCTIGSMVSYSQIKVLWGDTKDIDILSLRSFLIVGVEVDTIHVVAFLCAPGRLQCAVQWSDSIDGCLLQLRDGSLLEYERSRSTSILPSEVEPLLELCPWIKAIKDSAPYSDTSHSSRLVFGLSSRSRLYFNDVMLTESASSFVLSLDHEFLSYVTSGSRCQVRFLPLKELHDFDPLMGLEHNYLLEGYEPRSVEQGSRLVAILPQQPQMILQMPRGNLEGVYPRALVLRFVMSRIIRGEYSETFRMMRKHKVDLNLIVDLHPKEFLESGISSFVKQVDVIDYLNLFVSNLQDYDVTESRFPVPTWLRGKSDKSKEWFDFSTKVNEVCRKARSVMIDIEKSGDKPNRYYLLPILSTFAKENPPRLDEALSLIKDDALKVHSGKLSTNPLFSETAQSSIRYLAFLAEYVLLFETALGMYDYDIARAVARNSQMDPKMYLPLLKRFNALPKFFSRYEVDMRLKRFDTALTNLYQSGNSFEDCMQLINDHKLYKLGLNLFRADTDKTKTILIALGNSLMEEKRPSTALAVFLSTDPPYIDGAIRAARGAHDWRCYFSLLDAEDNERSTDQEEYRIERRRQAAREIANEITTSNYSSKTKRKAYSDASRILMDYGDDLIGAVDCLITAECWSEGYRVANLHSRQDLTNKCI
ncbi:IKI3-domain-containing protein, partial [Fragilariopsis cylindrus CCMP1102]